MHGTYRFEEADGVRIYALLPDPAVLASQFPAYRITDGPSRRSLVVRVAQVGFIAAMLTTTGVRPASEPAIPIKATRTSKSTVAPRTQAPAAPQLVMAPSDPLTSVPSPASTPPPVLHPPSTSIDAIANRPKLDNRTAKNAAAGASVDWWSMPVAPVVKGELAVRVDGVVTGAALFDDAEGIVRVELGAVLAAVADRFEETEYRRLAASPAAAELIPVERLAAAGIPVAYDPVYDEIVMKTSDADLTAIVTATTTADQLQPGPSA